MENSWSDAEINSAVRTYLWMREAEKAGHTPHKKRVREALLKGPLSTRSSGAIEYRFQNISHVLDSRGEAWVEGYKPAKNVGAATAENIGRAIADYNTNKSARRLNWLINGLPADSVLRAVTELSQGKSYDYPDSVDYDVVHAGVAVPPKKAISYAALLHYHAPLLPANCSGGEGTTCFLRLEQCGLVICKKGDLEDTDPKQEAFRRKVAAAKRRSGATRPEETRSRPAGARRR